MAEMSKLQIRAKVLSVLSEIKSDNNFNSELLLSYIAKLSDIEDRKTLFDIVLKEVIKMSDDEVSFCACLVKELVSKEYVEEAIFEVLKSSSFSDEAKYKLVQLLRVVGSVSAINEVPQFFDNPQGLIDLETEKMLERASFNPETMLDFLDFIYAVSDRDKSLLLSSLKEDYAGDNLANLIYPVLYSDFTSDVKMQVVEILSESKSSLALKPFEYLLNVTEDKSLISALELGLKKLKLSGATEEKANNYYLELLKGSKPYDFYTTIPDGAGNQALLASMINKENNINFVAVVINDLVGVVDCFGFYNITKDETNRIISKFYQSEGKYRVSEKYIKTQILSAIRTSINNKLSLPYEFICWNTLLFNIEALENTLDDYLKSIQIEKSVDKNQIVELLSKEYTYRWFINSVENLSLNEAVEKIYNSVNLEKDYINNLLLEFADKIFDEKQENIWKNRLKHLIYLLNENAQKKDANLFVQILMNNDMFDLFKQIIVQRSVFNNLLLLRDNVKKSSLPINIFKKKIVSEEKYDIKQIEKVIVELKKYWINE